MRKPGNGKDRPPPGGRALERLRDFARARGLGTRPGDEPEPAQAEHADEPAAPDQAGGAEEAAEPSHPQEEERS